MDKAITTFLDRNNTIVAHLTERLDELRDSLLFSHLREPISATISLLETQTKKTEQLYKALGIPVSYTNNLAAISFLEYLFSCLPMKDNGAQYLCLADYLSAADALLAQSAHMVDISLNVENPGIDISGYELYNPTVLEPLNSAITQTGHLH